MTVIFKVHQTVANNFPLGIQIILYSHFSLIFHDNVSYTPRTGRYPRGREDYDQNDGQV